jgi:hypothetical protein
MPRPLRVIKIKTMNLHETNKGERVPGKNDNDADKSGTDKNADSTRTGGDDRDTEPGKFDKAKRETDPDRTDIDTGSDKTKKQNPENGEMNISII